MATDLVPSKPSALTDEEEEIARLMVYGLPHEEVILGKVVKPDWPLTLEQAAKFVGYRLKRARTYLDDMPAFSTHRRELLAGKRSAELPRNLMTAIETAMIPAKTARPIGRCGSRRSASSRATKARAPSSSMSTKQTTRRQSRPGM